MLTFRKQNICLDQFIIIISILLGGNFAAASLNTHLPINDSHANVALKSASPITYLDATNINYREQDTITIREAQADVKPRDCAEAVQPGFRSGVYQIYPPIFGSKGFPVYCLVDPNRNGSAWTVFQRRQDGSVNFFRNWNSYQNGFGDLNGEFFIGLDKLHVLTSNARMELWVQLEDFDGYTKYAKYKTFVIGNKQRDYYLTVDNYHGTAGDSMAFSNQAKFETFDHWITSYNCPNRNKGAWWYNDCTQSNLNGLHLDGKTSDITGIFWYTFRYSYYTLKYAHMAIRAY